MTRIIWIAAILALASLNLVAQQGRGGGPLAWNDTDKDGICDITKKPVGQNAGRGRQIGATNPAASGQGQTFLAGRGPCGRGMARAQTAGTIWRGRGRGRGMAARGRGRGMAWRRPVNPSASAEAPATAGADSEDQ
jgi:hypothetical protein